MVVYTVTYGNGYKYEVDRWETDEGIFSKKTAAIKQAEEVFYGNGHVVFEKRSDGCDPWAAVQRVVVDKPQHGYKTVFSISVSAGPRHFKVYG
jgi:hypothetical protein